MEEKPKKRFDAPNSLGISKADYAIGKSGRDLIVGWLVGTVALFIPIHFGQGKGGVVDKVLGLFKKVKESFNFSGVRGDKKILASVALAASLGWVVGHIYQIPGFRKGWKTADTAIAIHDKTIAENETLKEENKILASEIAKINAATNIAAHSHTAAQQLREASAEHTTAGRGA